MWIWKPILYFASNDSLTKIQFPYLWTDLNNFFLTLKFDGDPKSNILLYLKCLTGPQKSNFLFMDRFEYFFLLSLRLGLTWKFDGDSKSNIEVYLKWLSEPPKSNFLVYGPISTNFFSFNWKFIRDSKLDIKVYSKWLSEPQSPISCLWTNFNQYFFFQLEIHWGFQI